MLKKIILAVVMAVILGVVVMLTPIVAYTQVNVTRTQISEQKGENNIGDASPSFSYSSKGLEGAYNAAQTYGRMDAGPGLSSVLLQVTLLIATGLATALYVSLYFIRRV